MSKKNKKQRLLSPVLTMIILIAIAILSSSWLSLLNVEGTQTTIENGMLETSIVVVRNIFSKEGFTYFFSNVMTNFNLLQPLAMIILSLMAVGIAKSSGLLKHLFSPFRKLRSNVLTFIVIFVGIISTMIGDYSYIILIPLVAVLYQYANRSPVLGIITLFLGITLGYGTGIIYNYNDYALGMLTEAAAIIDVDSSYKFNLNSNLYIMIASTIILSFLLTVLVEKYLNKKITITDKSEDELVTSKKALTFSLTGFALCLIGIILLIIPGGLLLDPTQNVYIAKLFSPSAPFNLSFMFLFLLLISVTGLIYGLVSKNFKNNHDFGFSFTKEFNNIGYLFVLMFLSAILIAIVDWTNLGVVVANKLIYLISLFDFTGILLIIVSFIFIVLMSILIPGSIEKWVLISPVLVPLFMRGNLTPDFAQFVFKAADSVGKIITPLFIFFIIMVGFIQKYNTNENKVTLFNTLRLILPIIIITVIFWLLLLVVWYIAGLPLGIDTLATM